MKADLGMIYDELSVFGRLCKIKKHGPYSIFTKLVREWGSIFSPIQVGTFDPTCCISKTVVRLCESVKLWRPIATDTPPWPQIRPQHPRSSAKFVLGCWASVRLCSAVCIVSFLLCVVRSAVWIRPGSKQKHNIYSEGTHSLLNMSAVL